eukprot:TRINITY_DN2648_c0_g1_i3.p1 TRINITY_DN2648_c0_g1~~TRINITY_DN2648_c0_g1_i3.p1  ORF type:complete len:332 (-),score=70.77 TRINITY_DN2648_c0_g1_i3:41-1036(-)
MTETPFVVELSGANPVMTALPGPKEEDEKKTAGKLTPKTGVMVAAAYTKRGDLIYTGNSRGIISIINHTSLQIIQYLLISICCTVQEQIILTKLFIFCSSLTLVSLSSLAVSFSHYAHMGRTIKVPGGAGIKSIQFSRNGKFFLVNSNDKMVRVFDKESSALLREFQDLINKMQWKQACFSSDTDYIIGGSAQKAEHNIYIWNRSDGQLVKILEGPKEGILDLAWHPLRPIIGSVAATSGLVYIWSTNYTENWSAFAPDFKELEENVEYVEREDEFDIVEEQEQKRRQEENEDEEVDIMTIEKISAFSSDEDDDLFFLPTVPERDSTRLHQ